VVEATSDNITKFKVFDKWFALNQKPQRSASAGAATAVLAAANDNQAKQEQRNSKPVLRKDL
jgi:hypothetical protein